MKELSIEELTSLMCSTGYLPPRTEDELNFFEQLYESYEPRIKDRPIDIESIISGSCCVEKSNMYEYDTNGSSISMAAESGSDYSMAARNFDKLPKEIIEKMKQQHKPKQEDDDK